MTMKKPDQAPKGRDLTRRNPSASDPFETSHEREYPRAGVRVSADGYWKVTCWEGEHEVRVVEKTAFHDTFAEAVATAAYHVWFRRKAGAWHDTNDQHDWLSQAAA